MTAKDEEAPSIRLPLAIHDPRLAEARRGKVVFELALDIDFAPTLLSLAGVEAPQAMRRRMEVLQAKAGPPWKPER